MPELEQEEKARALEAHDSYDFIVDIGPVLTALASGLAIASPAGPIIGVGLAVMTLLAKRQAKTLKRIADDPPDPNYRRPAQRRPLSLHLEWLGHEPPGYQLARLCRDLLTSEAELRVFIGSVEKADGAALEEQPDFRAARLFEALTHARLAAQFLQETEATTAEAVQQLESVLPAELSRIPSEGTAPGDVEGREHPLLTDLLRDEELALLFRIGLSRGQVDVRMPRSLPWHEWNARRRAFLAHLSASGRAAGELGHTLEAWGEDLLSGGDPGSPPPGTVRW
jgi:hypothetical protein